MLCKESIVILQSCAVFTIRRLFTFVNVEYVQQSLVIFADNRIDGILELNFEFFRFFF